MSTEPEVLDAWAVALPGGGVDDSVRTAGRDLLGRRLHGTTQRGPFLTTKVRRIVKHAGVVTIYTTCGTVYHLGESVWSRCACGAVGGER